MRGPLIPRCKVLREQRIRTRTAAAARLGGQKTDVTLCKLHDVLAAEERGDEPVAKAA
jgi:hypothetical protein